MVGSNFTVLQSLYVFVTFILLLYFFLIKKKLFIIYRIGTYQVRLYRLAKSHDFFVRLTKFSAISRSHENWKDLTILLHLIPPKMRCAKNAIGWPKISDSTTVAVAFSFSLIALAAYNITSLIVSDRVRHVKVIC